MTDDLLRQSIIEIAAGVLDLQRKQDRTGMIIPGQNIEKLQALKPFAARTVAHGMSYGVGPAGYDVRIKDGLYLPAGRFELGVTVEEFDMPADVIGFVHDKSTWARRGLSLFNTVIEPGWKGYLTLELINNSQGGINIPEGCPIAQIIFMRLEAATATPYVGKYQNQPHHPVGAIKEVA
jgi:dCTP deaminase